MKRLLALVFLACPIALASAEEADSRFAVQASPCASPCVEGLYFLNDSIELRAFLDFGSAAWTSHWEGTALEAVDFFGAGADFKLFGYGEGGRHSFVLSPSLAVDTGFSAVAVQLTVKPLDSWRRVASKDFPLGLSVMPITVYAVLPFSGVDVSITPVMFRGASGFRVVA